MKRRRLLVLGSTAVATALAGCLGDDDDDDIEFDDPEAVVEAWVLAIYEPDFGTMERLVHEDIQRETPVVLSREERQDFASILDGHDRTVRETEVVAEYDDEVHVWITTTDDLPDSHGEYGELEATYVVRKEDGDWKIYDTKDAELTGIDGVS